MPNVLSASRDLLADVCLRLNNIGISYIVVGGWSPYLLNSTSLSHPGTKDVDILFSDADVAGGIRDVFDAFLSDDYFMSAKHDFQLLRAVPVGSRSLIFNVDFLHPSQVVKNPEMFIDHFDLGIDENDLGYPKISKSMVLPSSAILFEDGFHTRHSVSAGIGRQQLVEFDLLTEIGCVLSKCASVDTPKRHRDSFDIYLALRNVASETFLSKIRDYKHIPAVPELLKKLRAFLDVRSENPPHMKEFDRRVYKYSTIPSGEALPSEFVKRIVDAV